MKMFSKLTCGCPSVVCCYILLVITIANGQPALPPPMRPEVRTLLDIYQSDAPWADVKSGMQAEKVLRTRPDIKQDLLNGLQREYFIAKETPGAEISFSSLGALSLRSDLTSGELKIITDELERLVAEGDDKYFVNGGINLLANYPSPKHEDLVLRFLDRDDRQEHTLLSAFRTLSIIGSSRSLTVMLQMVARLRAKNSQYWFLKEMNEHIGTLETRLKQGAATTQTQTSPAPAQTQKLTTAIMPAMTSSEVSPTSMTDWRVWLGLLGGLILVIALSCRVFRQR